MAARRVVGSGGPTVRLEASAAGGRLTITAAAAMDPERVLRELDVPAEGLEAEEVVRRQGRYGLNAVASHRVNWVSVLWRQLRSPLLGLLLAAALVSALVGEGTDAKIIAIIVAASVGLGFVNEYRAEKAAEALHSQIRHQAVVTRGGRAVSVDVTELVPGDLVELTLGEIVPADIRLVEVSDLECEESVLTGESLPVDKTTLPVPEGSSLAELSCCALMGTVVHSGRGRGVVVATGAVTEFGVIAAGLSTHPLDTEFQLGLRRFSMMLVYVAGVLTTTIFVFNVLLGKPIIDALLFSLAIAVGITPQLLPAVVSTSLAAGSRQMSKRKVLVKRLVCIEDLGDIDILFTDKTGTLTEGRIEFMRAVPTDSMDADTLLRWGLLCTENLTAGAAVGGNPLDQALWQSPAAVTLREGAVRVERLAVLPFDHERRMVSVLVRLDGRLVLVTKGAPESVIDRCRDVAPEAHDVLAREFAAGNRVVAVASRPMGREGPLAASDESDLTLLGLLVFLDPPKVDAAQALDRLAGLGITVKVVTGDNPEVAAKVCHDLGLTDGKVLTGRDIDALDDTALAAAVPDATVFARVNPEHKARIVRVQRLKGGGVAFLGDGVNDALALHAADVGISVDSATDVAKDAADVILLAKDLDVLADGVAEGRRVFANTIKYVLMGTSSNFGNMFSAAAASLFLTFLPMLPSQILLNNLLYDTSQLAIPTDHVDEEQLRKPSHWDIGFIRRFMICFGPLSSVFDLITFAIMLGVFHSGAAQFRSGWFVESLATQTLIIFAIRTRRVPFFRSRPSLPLTLAAISVVLVGAALPASPLGPTLGFAPLPGGFFAVLVGLVIAYLVLVEVAKTLFFRVPTEPRLPRPYSPLPHRARRAARFSTAQPRPPRRPHGRTRTAAG
ncbi:MAG TPA: magnesium-translocating P-type ATPase [Actinomycetes bacterium]|nr:magnesium-translocating P-type ATPase [Actinomycetes bacterium]